MHEKVTEYRRSIEEAAPIPAQKRLLAMARGLPEAELDRSLGRLMERGRDPEISLTADDGILTVTLSSHGDRDAARADDFNIDKLKQAIGASADIH